MTTIMIAKNEEAMKQAIIKILREEGYCYRDFIDGENICIKIGNDETIQNLDYLNQKVIKLSESLYREKKGILYKSIFDAVEKSLIEDVLERTDGNQLKAADVLGINRNTIRAKIKKLSIDLNKWKA